MTKISRVALFMSLLFGAALTASVFYQGFYTEFLCLTLGLLVLWATWAVWAGYTGLAVSYSGIAVCVTLYWGWLWVAGFWGAVSYLGIISAWWLGALPLVFWIYSLSPQRDTLWKFAYRMAVVVGVALAVYAAYQWLALHHEPQATFLNRQSLAALLNLVSIPLCGYFLLGARNFPAWPQWVRGGALFVLAFVLGIIEGRGATLAGVIALVLLLSMAWRYVPMRVVAQLVAIVVPAFVIASQLGRVGLGNRMEALVGNPWVAGSDRLLIWQQSWEMLKQAPWMGVGLGHYALYWPPFRNPADPTGGYFAHNDYLQIWIEAGLPGLLILIALLVSVLMGYVRALATAEPARKVEMTALFAGLLAVAAHSVVDFNLYVLSILLLAGLTLGRLHALATEGSPKVVHVMPSRLMSAPGFRLIVGLVAVLPLFYFSMLSMASFEYGRGLQFANDARWDESYRSLSRAEQVYPYADNVLMSKADLLRSLLAEVPHAPAGERQALFDESKELLARAETLNPLRPQTPAVRGLLYEQNPAFAGSDWKDEVLRNYRRVLALEPRAYEVRHLYASFLLKQGRRDEARQIVEEGMKYQYSNVGSILPYYTLTAVLRRESGDRDGARELTERIEAINSSGQRWVSTRYGETAVREGDPAAAGK